MQESRTVPESLIQKIRSEDTVVLQNKFTSTNQLVESYEQAIDNFFGHVAKQAILHEYANSGELFRAVKEGIFLFPLESEKSLIEPELKILQEVSGLISISRAAELRNCICERWAAISRLNALKDENIEAARLQRDIVKIVEFGLEPVKILRKLFSDELTRRVTNPHTATSETTMKQASVAPSQREEEWPPRSGWHFRPGEFAFNGRRGEINGVRQRLLERLVTARRALTLRELADTQAGDVHRMVDASTVRGNISDVRKVLRKIFHLLIDEDPIPHVDHGRQAAWKVSEGLLKSGIQRNSSSTGGIVGASSKPHGKRATKSQTQRKQAKHRQRNSHTTS